MRNLILLFVLISYSVIGQKKTTFKLRKSPELLETITTHLFFGNRNNTGFKTQNYDSPLFLKLYKNNTFLMFNSELVGDSLGIVYHYFNKKEEVYRGHFKLDSNNNFELNVIQGNLNCNIKLRTLATAVGGTVSMKNKFNFIMYKGALLRTFTGKVKPSLFPADGVTDLLEMYSLETYYKLINLSEENEEALKLLHPEMFKNENKNATNRSNN